MPEMTALLLRDGGEVLHINGSHPLGSHKIPESAWTSVTREEAKAKGVWKMCIWCMVRRSCGHH